MLEALPAVNKCAIPPEDAPLPPITAELDNAGPIPTTRLTTSQERSMLITTTPPSPLMTASSKDDNTEHYTYILLTFYFNEEYS